MPCALLLLVLKVLTLKILALLVLSLQDLALRLGPLLILLDIGARPCLWVQQALRHSRTRKADGNQGASKTSYISHSNSGLAGASLLKRFEQSPGDPGRVRDED